MSQKQGFSLFLILIVILILGGFGFRVYQLSKNSSVAEHSPTTSQQLNPKCSLQAEAGPCKAVFERYYFDPESKSCKKFIWGGCQGVVPFETLEDCNNSCVQ